MPQVAPSEKLRKESDAPVESEGQAELFARELRYQRATAMLAGTQGGRYALVTDAAFNADGVIVTLAVGPPSSAIAEIFIPRRGYDPFVLLALVARHADA